MRLHGLLWSLLNFDAKLRITRREFVEDYFTKVIFWHITDEMEAQKVTCKYL